MPVLFSLVEHLVSKYLGNLAVWQHGGAFMQRGNILMQQVQQLASLILLHQPTTSRICANRILVPSEATATSGTWPNVSSDPIQTPVNAFHVPAL